MKILWCLMSLGILPHAADMKSGIDYFMTKTGGMNISAPHHTSVAGYRR